MLAVAVFQHTWIRSRLRLEYEWISDGKGVAQLYSEVLGEGRSVGAEYGARPTYVVDGSA